MKKYNDFLGLTEASFAIVEEDDKKYMEGYAVRFGIKEKNMRKDRKTAELFYYMVDPGAFDQLLASEDLDVSLVYEHEAKLIMARTTSGTLELFKEEDGIRFKAEIAEVSYANDVYTLIQRGDLSEMSFKALFLDGEDTEDQTDESGAPIRVIKNVRRFLDVSVVTSPAFDQTSVIAAGEDEEAKKEVTEEPIQKDEPITYSSEIYKKRTYLKKLKK